MGEVNISTTIKIYEAIFELQKVPFIAAGDGNTTTMLPGVGFEKSYFPIETPVAFTTDMTRGSQVNYAWDFGENVPSTYLTTVYPDVVHTFVQPGTFVVTLNATNPLSKVELQRTVHIQRSVAGISLFTATQTYPKNRTFEFIVDAGVVGTDACYFIDFIDINSTTPYIYFAGNQNQCQESFPTQWAKTTGKTFQQITNADFVANGPTWTVKNHYMVKGMYNLKLMAANQVILVTTNIYMYLLRFNPVIGQF